MHAIDLHALTVTYTDPNGEVTDLNAQGEPCRTIADLVEFVDELCAQGAYDQSTADSLMVQIYRHWREAHHPRAANHPTADSLKLSRR